MINTEASASEQLVTGVAAAGGVWIKLQFYCTYSNEVQFTDTCEGVSDD